MLTKRVWIVTALVLAIAVPVLARQQSAAEKIIQGPIVEGVGDTWAVIAWTTNTGGSTIVRYGANPNALNETAQSSYSDNDRTSTQNHRVHLKNLKPGTTYYFIADSSQGEGTGTEAKSSVGQFTTKGAGQSSNFGHPSGQSMAVRITDGPRVEGAGDTWAEISWTTSTGGSSVVRYGTDRNALNQTAESPYADNEKTSAQNHRVRLTNLKPNTTYYFIADSGQGEGTGTEARSSIGQFTTKAH
jgi:phosphodiesterase/alkaline phosphatase D-like protein